MMAALGGVVRFFDWLKDNKNMSIIDTIAAKTTITGSTTAVGGATVSAVGGDAAAALGITFLGVPMEYWPIIIGMTGAGAAVLGALVTITVKVADYFDKREHRKNIETIMREKVGAFMNGDKL